MGRPERKRGILEPDRDRILNRGAVVVAEMVEGHARRTGGKRRAPGRNHRITIVRTGIQDRHPGEIGFLLRERADNRIEVVVNVDRENHEVERVIGADDRGVGHGVAEGRIVELSQNLRAERQHLERGDDVFGGTALFPAEEAEVVDQLQRARHGVDRAEQLRRGVGDDGVKHRLYVHIDGAHAAVRCSQRNQFADVAAVIACLLDVPARQHASVAARDDVGLRNRDLQARMRGRVAGTEPVQRLRHADRTRHAAAHEGIRIVDVAVTTPGRRAAGVGASGVVDSEGLEAPVVAILGFETGPGSWALADPVYEDKRRLDERDRLREHDAAPGGLFDANRQHDGALRRVVRPADVELDGRVVVLLERRARRRV